MGWLPDKSVNPTLIYDNYLLDGAVSFINKLLLLLFIWK